MTNLNKKTTIPNLEYHREPIEQHLGNLLAVIHGDGGHYQIKVGRKKATEEAIEMIIKLRTELEELKKDKERLDTLEEVLIVHPPSTKTRCDEEPIFPYLGYDADGIRGEKYWELQLWNRYFTGDTLREVIDRIILDESK